MFIFDSITFHIYQSRSSFLIFLKFFHIFPKQKLLVMSRFASILLPTIITITEMPLLLVFYYFFYRLLLISLYGIIFNKMPIEDYIPLFKSFIFFSLRYQSYDILCTFKQCHYSSNSTSIILPSIIFSSQINIFDCWNKSIVVSEFSMRRVEIDSDNIYFI